MIDSINAEVIELLKANAARGLSEYGKTMDREDLSLEEWLKHLRSELLDAAIYATKILRELDNTMGLQQSLTAHRKPRNNTKLKAMEAIVSIVEFNELNPDDRWCITKKLLLKITGSGEKTIANLIQNDPQIKTIVSSYNEQNGLSPRDNQRGRGRSFPVQK